MHIKSLKLRNFRNYENLETEFNKNLNIIFGYNGQGKTNILEAMYICASGRSHRTPRDGELVRHGENGYYIKLEVAKSDGESTIEIIFRNNEKKRVKINDIPIRKMGSLMGNVNAIIFSPEDFTMIKEGPAERRRFLDMSISQIRPSYFYSLQQYIKILCQRNALLKEIGRNGKLSDTLEEWNRSLVNEGAKIIKERYNFINRLNRFAEGNHYKLTENAERLEIKYMPSVKMDKCDNSGEIEERFLKIIERSIRNELERCMTLHGPHRDDFEVLLNGNSIRAYGSQGQQRTAILSLKLSEIEIMKEEAGEYPVLLLDDVLSELDENRRNYLLRSIKDMQTFLTCTEKNCVNANNEIMPHHSFYNVCEGTIKVF